MVVASPPINLNIVHIIVAVVRKVKVDAGVKTIKDN